MARIAHAAAALAIIAFAALCLVGLAARTTSGEGASSTRACQGVLCMVAIS